MKLKYDNHDDANMYLGDTVVMYRGEPFHVHRIDETLTYHGNILGQRTAIAVPQDDEELSLSAPRLGYANTSRGATYLKRRPSRTVKQGLVLGRLVGGREGLEAPALYRCLTNDYPSIEAALRSFQGTNPFKPSEVESVAFSRHFAIDRRQRLLYKGQVCGGMDGTTPVLNEQHEWLTEALQEVLDV